MVLGSEGRLGIVSEATVHVHRVPVRRIILGYLLPTWAAGLAAMHDIAAGEATPTVTRVSDANETRFSFATKKASSPLDRIKSRTLAEFLQRRRDFDLDAMCLAFIGYEGSKRHVRAQRNLAGRIVARHGGVCIGSGPGDLYDQKKFDTPYIRDYLLDRGALADVSETAAPWSLLPKVYDSVMGAAHAAFRSLGVPGYIMCHLSHSYHSGACLYFTFAFKPSGERDPPAEYDVVKSAIQQTFVTPAPRSRTTMRWAPSTRRGWSRTSRHPVSRVARAVRRCRSGRQPQPREGRLTPGRLGLASRAAEAHHR
jgi:alkyldihydroxyacetonephosphate synthase